MTMLLMIVGLALVAVLTAAAAAVRSVNRIWLRHWVEQRLAGRATTSLSLDDVQRLLLAAGTAVALVAFATGAAMGERWPDDFQTLIERVAIAALVVLVLGQLVPRAVGRRWGTSLVPKLVPGLRGVTNVLNPVVRLAQRAVAFSAGTAAPAEAPQRDEREQLEDLLREGELEGLGDAGESAIISGVVDFTVKRAREVMTPRAEIFHLDRSLDGNALLGQVAQARYSRVPVTDGGLDHVVGLIHAFDALKWEPGTPLPLRRAAFARDDEPATDLLARMLRGRMHLVVVQDAAGQTAGVVTLEDLLEELVGDIRDEHDEPAPAP